MSLKASTIPEFDPPGNLDDLKPENRAGWSKKISGWMDAEIGGGGPGPCNKPRTPLPQFFNGTVTAFDTTQTPIPVTWIGFPNIIATRYQNAEPLRWQIADANRLSQDEYLEWPVARDQNNKITSIKFTCEGPEYWQYLADFQEDSILPLYQELNPEFADQMSKGDFFLTNEKTGATVYNPMNYWNMSSTSGTIAHLVQPNNTLSTEINIATQATVIRMNEQGEIITDSLELINCSQYGNPGRNSDPVIGSSINNFARNETSLSVANPVALYINGFDTSNFRLAKSPTNMVPLPDGIVTWVRGKPGEGLRIHVKIPEGTLSDDGVQLTVSDIYDTSKKVYVLYAAQFADYISMSVSAVAIGDFTVATAQKCPCAKQTRRGDLMPGKGTFDGIIRSPEGVEQHRLPKYKFRVR